MIAAHTRISLLVVLTSTSPAFAQDRPELVTDRPDFTESSEVVGRGAVQIETGFTLESDRAGDIQSRAITVPAILARIGVGSRVELRVGGDGYLRGWISGPSSEAVSGYSDVDVGAKVKLLDRDGFDMSVIPILSVPTYNTHYSSRTYDSAVKLTWATDLPRDFGLSGNANVVRRGNEFGRFSQGAFSASLSHALAERWSSYGEGYVFTPVLGEAGAAWTVNGGVTRAIGPDMQLDLEIGRGVSARAVDWFLGVGFTVRHLPGSDGSP
jgi:hypothetical protein